MDFLAKEHLGITLRRVVAWWIDAFLAAAIIMVVRWTINALFDAPITGHAAAIYDIAALAGVFYLYRVICEARKRTSLGKWSLQLRVITDKPGWWSAALRNSWILLTLISLTGVPHVEAIVLGVLGISVVATGQTPFDMLANCLVERRPLPF